MAFRPHRKMKLGHVAAVSKVIDSRTVLLDHANWSPINGRRGQIERDVKAIDVSPNNDWSEVRVWYAPIQALGKASWPVHGFIYGDGKPNAQPRSLAPRTHVAATREPSKQFASAFSALGKAPAPAKFRKAPALKPQRRMQAGKAFAAARIAAAPAKQRSRPAIAFAQVIARYE